eukprot:1082527-Pleurochrysis_carterae.AAC.8
MAHAKRCVRSKFLSRITGPSVPSAGDARSVAAAVGVCCELRAAMNRVIAGTKSASWESRPAYLGARDVFHKRKANN